MMNYSETYDCRLTSKIRKFKIRVKFIGKLFLSYHINFHTVGLAPTNQMTPYQNQHKMIDLVYQSSLNPSNMSVNRKQ